MKFEYEDMTHPFSNFYLFESKSLAKKFLPNINTNNNTQCLVSINQILLLVRMFSTNSFISEQNICSLIHVHHQADSSSSVNLARFKFQHDYYLQNIIENTLISESEIRDPQMMSICNITFAAFEFAVNLIRFPEIFDKLLKVIIMTKVIDDQKTYNALVTEASMNRNIICTSARLHFINPNTFLANYLTYICGSIGRIYNEIGFSIVPSIPRNHQNACLFTILSFQFFIAKKLENNRMMTYVQNKATEIFLKDYSYYINSKTDIDLCEVDYDIISFFSTKENRFMVEKFTFPGLTIEELDEDQYYGGIGNKRKI